MVGQQFAKRAGMTLLGPLHHRSLWRAHPAQPRRSALHPGSRLPEVSSHHPAKMAALALPAPAAHPPSGHRPQDTWPKPDGENRQTPDHHGCDATSGRGDVQTIRLSPDDPRPHPQARYPRRHLDGHPVRRIVLGDWFEQGSVLVCCPGEQRLEVRGAGSGVSARQCANPSGSSTSPSISPHRSRHPVHNAPGRERNKPRALT